MMLRSIPPALILFLGILVQADGQTDRAYMVLQKQNLGKARAAMWRHTPLTYPFFSPHRRPEPNKRYRVTNVNDFITYLLCVCVCRRSYSGKCVCCAAAAHDCHGCVCVQASLPTLKRSPARKRPKRAEKQRVAKHLDRVRLRKTAQLLRINRVRCNYTCNSFLPYRHASVFLWRMVYSFNLHINKQWFQYHFGYLNKNSGKFWFWNQALRTS